MSTSLHAGGQVHSQDQTVPRALLAVTLGTGMALNHSMKKCYLLKLGLVDEVNQNWKYVKLNT